MTRYPRINFGVFLEGESTFCELLHNLSEPEKVPGIFYRKNEILKFSGGRDFIDLQIIEPRLKYIASPNKYHT